MAWHVWITCCLMFHLSIWYLTSTCSSSSFCAPAPKTSGFSKPTLKSAVIVCCYAASPVWATICVHPLQTWRTFSPPSRDRFTGVAEDRKGSLLISWPCLLLPQRNKSPSSGDKRNIGMCAVCCTVTMVTSRPKWKCTFKSRWLNITWTQQHLCITPVKHPQCIDPAVTIREVFWSRPANTHICSFADHRGHNMNSEKSTLKEQLMINLL